MEDKDMQELEQEQQEAIMPEGYGEGDDYFEEESWGKEAKVDEQAEPEAAPGGGEEEKGRDLRGEAEAYFAKHPGYLGREVPGSVMRAWLGGCGLGEAYAEYERGQSRAETRKLQRENQVLRQNAEAAARAPVRGVGGGGDTKQEPLDPFLVGFESEGW